MTTELKHRSDAGMPYQEWRPFSNDTLVEVENAYGDKRVGLVKDFWWGYERELGGVGEGVIISARKVAEMMTEHEAVPGTEYYGDDHYEDQEGDEEEMAQWYEFDAYQDFTDTTAIYPQDNAQEYLMYGLISEVGELAGNLKKVIRDGTPLYTEDFLKELGDVLWYVSQLASSQGFFLSDVARVNVEKLKSRQDRGKLGGSGDSR